MMIIHTSETSTTRFLSSFLKTLNELYTRIGFQLVGTNQHSKKFDLGMIGKVF